jgi:16S rRNA (cytosine1402-N4)-methyltransferase
MGAVHKSVLLKEVMSCLQVAAGEKYIDATLGQAGHSLGIAKAGGVVLGIEANDKTFNWVRDYLGKLNDPTLRGQIKVVRGNFKNIGEIAKGGGFSKVAGVLFDLGLSTYELREGGLGFSFLKNEPLDMRLDHESGGVSAQDLVNSLEKDELYGIFTKFGEERDAERIVSAIVRGRRIKKVETSFDLVSLIDSAYQPKLSRPALVKHLAKVFQSLRIAVNDELNSLRAALSQTLNLVSSGGRVCVISFHSLEDRVVKEQFRAWQSGRLGFQLNKTPITADHDGLRANRSERSAKLRVFEKM